MSDWSPPAEDSLDWTPPSDDTITSPEGSFVGGVLRQLGLTARYAIEGGLGLADLAASPIRAVGNAIRPGTFSPAGEVIADSLDLPQPQGGFEEGVADVSRSLAGAGGFAGGAKVLENSVVSAAKPAMQWLAANPAMQAQAAIGAGSGAAIARETEMGPVGTFAMQLAGSLAFPVGVRATRAAIEPLMDIGATIGASAGNKRGIQRLATDAVERGLVSKKNIDSARVAAQNATEFVPGAKPTMADAIAEYNMKPPVVGAAKTTGGWIARLQKDLTGARFVEDALSGNAKRTAAVITRAKETLLADTAKMREPILDVVNGAGGIRADRILSNLDDLASNPEVYGDRTMATAVRLATRDVMKLNRGKVVNKVIVDGRINAKAIYAARKFFNKTVAKAAEVEEGSLTSRDLKKMGWITHQIQLAVDDAIEEVATTQGKGGQWKAYLDKYSSGMKLIESHLDRAEFATEMAKGVKPLGSSIVPGELPHPPTLLNRKMMFVNWGLKLMGTDANTPVVKDLVRRLEDPAEFAKLLERPLKDPLRVFADEAMRRGSLAAGVSSVANEEQE